MEHASVIVSKIRLQIRANNVRRLVLMDVKGPQIVIHVKTYYALTAYNGLYVIPVSLTPVVNHVNVTLDFISMAHNVESVILDVLYVKMVLT